MCYCQLYHFDGLFRKVRRDRQIGRRCGAVQKVRHTCRPGCQRRRPPCPATEGMPRWRVTMRTPRWRRLDATGTGRQRRRARPMTITSSTRCSITAASSAAIRSRFTPITPRPHARGPQVHHCRAELREPEGRRPLQGAEGQMLGLVLDGDEVRAARVAGAPTREALRAATAPPRPAARPGTRGPLAGLSLPPLQPLDRRPAAPRRGAEGPYLCAICGAALRSGMTTERRSTRFPWMKRSRC